MLSTPGRRLVSTGASVPGDSLDDAAVDRRMLGVDRRPWAKGRGCGRAAGYVRRLAAETAHRGPADPGRTGRGGRAEPAVGQRPGAGYRHRAAPGDGPAASRRAAPTRPGPGGVRSSRPGSA